MPVTIRRAPVRFGGGLHLEDAARTVGVSRLTTEDGTPEAEPDDFLAVVLLETLIRDLTDHHGHPRGLAQIVDEQTERGGRAPPIVMVGLQQLEVEQAGIVDLVETAVHRLRVQREHPSVGVVGSDVASDLGEAVLLERRVLLAAISDRQALCRELVQLVGRARWPEWHRQLTRQAPDDGVSAPPAIMYRQCCSIRWTPIGGR